MTTKLPPWSYSSLKKFETCPRQYYETKIAKSVIDEPGEAAKLGSVIHKHMEDHLTGAAPMPKQYNRYRGYADTILKWPGTTTPEYQLALTKEMTPTTFTSPDAWGRGMIDVLNIDGNTAKIVDWKNGKYREGESRAQSAVYAAMTFACFSEITVVKARWMYLNVPTGDSHQYDRRDLKHLMKPVLKTVSDMEWAHETGVWAERPSGLCNGWCPVKQCRHWKPGRGR